MNPARWGRARDGSRRGTMSGEVLNLRGAGAERERRVRAMRAYLAGLGTAGSLVAGAALLFVLASAFVAFHGWPKVGTEPAPAAVVVSPAQPAGAPSPAGRRLAVLAGPIRTSTAAPRPGRRGPRAASVPKVSGPGGRTRARGGSAVEAAPRPVLVRVPAGPGVTRPASPAGSCAGGCGGPVTGTADAVAGAVAGTSPAAARTVVSAAALAAGTLSTADSALPGH